MGSGFSKHKKQMKMLQQQFVQRQQEIENVKAEGSSSGGLVTITLSGTFEMLSLKINPECVDKDDIEGLQDLIKEAYQQAAKKIEALQSNSTPSLPF